jgi:hypothetical protein
MAEKAGDDKVETMFTNSQQSPTSTPHSVILYTVQLQFKVILWITIGWCF